MDAWSMISLSTIELRQIVGSAAFMHRARSTEQFFFYSLEGPLCNTPVAIPLGQDPNVRMDGHLTNECSVMTGRAKARTSRVCAKGNCRKVLFSPIKCTVRLFATCTWRLSDRHIVAMSRAILSLSSISSRP